MPSTYEPIATTTLGSATNSVTFSSIAGTYTDLIIIVQGSVGSISGVNLQFNSDTATNYSRTVLYGTGSVASSTRGTNGVQISSGTFTTSQNMLRVNVMNYGNSTTYKTTLSRADAANEELTAIAGLWRSTAAITSIKVAADAGINFSIGSTFTLYGIKAA
jgi:hypothetical protein